MRIVTSRCRAAFAVSLVLSFLSLSQFASAEAKRAADLGRAEVRITAPVNEAARVALPNSVHPKVARGEDLGRVDGATSTGALRLMLSATPAQEHDLQTLVDLQQDKNSDSFHKWIQPEEFGARFGAHDADIAKLTAWLIKHGFAVDHVAKGKRAITFHGTVAQVEEAFATEMHRIRVGGEDHVANTKPVSIPAAFTKVVAGVSRLNDFMPRQPHTPFAKATRDSNGMWHSEFSSSNGAYYMAPGDFATIYNTQPLLAAGQEPKADRRVLVKQLGTTLKMDMAPFETLLDIREDKSGPDPGDPGELFAQYLQCIRTLVEYVDQLEEKK